MRVLLLNYEFPPVGGGAATASAQIAKHMAARGVEVVVLTSHLKGLPRLEEKDGYTIHRVPVMRRRLDQCSMPEMAAFIVGAAVPALRLASKFKPDLLHVFFGMPTGPVGLLVSWLKGIPYLLSLRGGDVPGFMGKELALAHKLTRPLTKRVWSAASTIIVNSEGLHELAQRTLPNRRFEIVPNGIDLEHFHPVEKADESDLKVEFLFVGRLVGQKGLSYLLRSLANVEPHFLQRIEVELVGSGPEDEHLRLLCSHLGLQNVVRFPGWVPRTDIVQHYQEADVFVLPSLDEGMPNVVLEAMACGNAIVATDIRGNRELVQDGVNGLLAPPADTAALTQALQTLTCDAAMRKRMGMKSRELISRYSWARTADHYLALSQRIVTSHAVHAVKKGSSIASELVLADSEIPDFDRH